MKKNQHAVWAVDVLEQRSKHGFIHIDIGDKNSLELIGLEESKHSSARNSVPSLLNDVCSRKHSRFSIPSLDGYIFLPRIFRKSSEHSFLLLNISILGAYFVVDSGLKIPVKFSILLRGVDGSAFSLKCLRVHTQKHSVKNYLAVGVRFINPGQSFKDFIIKSSLRAKIK
jgi:hypothetical protein